MATAEAARVAQTYFDSWRANDFDALRTILADDVAFTGPLAQVVGADEYRDRWHRRSRSRTGAMSKTGRSHGSRSPSTRAG